MLDHHTVSLSVSYLKVEWENPRWYGMDGEGRGSPGSGLALESSVGGQGHFWGKLKAGTGTLGAGKLQG